MADVPVQLIDDPQFLGGIFQELENDYNAADYRQAFEEFLPDLIADHRSNFDGRHDPNGDPFLPLSPYTVKKKGHDQPLVETNRLRASVLNLDHPDHLGEVTDRYLTFGTDVPYGIFHQEGRGVPQRAFVGMNEPLLENISNRVADRAVEELKAKV